METLEYQFTCPYCWTSISMVLDPSAESQSYIEDCEACCNPIEITYHIEDEQISEFSAMKAQ